MKAIVCELCGSNDIVKQGDYFVCQHCGTKYNLEEAKKLIGTVKIDYSEEVEKLYIAARRAKEENNAESAVLYYEQVLAKDPMSWEASFYTVYFRAVQCRIAEIRAAATSMSNCLNSVLTLIKQNVEEEKQLAAVSEVSSRTISLSKMLYIAAEKHYKEIDSDIRHKYGPEYTNNCDAARDLDYHLGDTINALFEGRSFKEWAIKAWKEGFSLHQNHAYLDANVLAKYRAKISNTFAIINCEGKTSAELINAAASEMESNSIDTAIAIFKILEDSPKYKPLSLLGQAICNLLQTNYHAFAKAVSIKLLHDAELEFSEDIRKEFSKQIKTIVSASSNTRHTALMIVARNLDNQGVRFFFTFFGGRC